jgi:redox-sensitive bicupin YhaK (pirin superfamily)
MNPSSPDGSTRLLQRVIPGMPTSDGAGVKLRRSIGAQPSARLDPFLMLDEFYSDDAADYIAGFPSHPHRGFETVTYMLDGHMLHEDHLGNRGDLLPGAVQWMTAGRGIIHSEMPQQESGRMRGFQLWLNLPARSKLQPAWYRDIAPDEVPELALDGGGRIKVIAGSAEISGQRIAGAIGGERWAQSTDPIYWDVRLPAAGETELPLPAGHHAFVYLYEGQAAVGPAAAPAPLPLQAAAVLGPGDRLRLQAGPAGARALVLAGRPLNEPVAQYGPFVMNTRAELEQAVADYQQGRLTAPA